MTADVELLPCPFCGGRAKTKLPYVRCVDCGGQMCFGDGDVFDAAIAAWNTRAHATAAKDAEIAQLEKANEQLHAHGERMHAEIERLRAEREVIAAEAVKYADKSRRLEARAEQLAEEIDWIKFQPEDDRMFAEIEAAAKASFHRHRTSCRGQVLTRADNYESHLVWATLEWAKRTNGVEKHAERLAEALREIERRMPHDRAGPAWIARSLAREALSAAQENDDA